MKDKMINQPIYRPSFAPLAFVPRKITNMGILVYVAALLVCAMVYNQYAMNWYFWLFGLIEVCGFFYFANYFTKAWVSVRSAIFIKKLFWLAIALRIAWVLISYMLYYNWTGTPFSVGAADELIYHAAASEIAEFIRDGNWNLYKLASCAMGAKSGISDLGYPIYLSLIYWIFGNSIIIARIIKAALSAWTAVLIYKLAARNFGEHVGRMAGVFCMLMPNLIFYCSFQLKEVEMVFLAVLFIERADFLLRRGKLSFLPTAALMLIPTYMFMIRTALAATLLLAFLCAVLLTSGRVIALGKRVMLSIIAAIFTIVMLFSATSMGDEVREMWNTGGSKQQQNMEWRSQRSGKNSQKFAKYAGAAVFAPMIFTIPFPTIVDIPEQVNQQLIHGGNYVKNILSFFTIMSLFILLLSGDWRKHVLILAVMCGYMVVLALSNFAHSERFHQPVLPFILMFAAYGIGLRNQDQWIRKGFPYWCALMFVAAVAWNWFKLAGRGWI